MANKWKLFSAFIVIGIIQHFSVAAQSKQLKPGDTAPFFSLKDQNDSLFNSKDYLGRKILVVYFYPKDESPVCTKESCSFRDSYEEYVKAGAMVVGINAGTVASHKQFRENHQLPFTLLSDPGNVVLKNFAVKNKWMFTGRETFVIDQSGKILFTFNSFTKGAAHNQSVIQYLHSLKPSTTEGGALH